MAFFFLYFLELSLQEYLFFDGSLLHCLGHGVISVLFVDLRVEGPVIHVGTEVRVYLLPGARAPSHLTMQLSDIVGVFAFLKLVQDSRPHIFQNCCA